LACYRFIELFAGIGGFRVGLETVTVGEASEPSRFKCVWASEMDKFARKSYEANFGHTPQGGDITIVPVANIPEHEILTAGFPCQPFSSVGASKRDMGAKSLTVIVIVTVSVNPDCR